MHRVCVADESKGKGVAGKMFSYGFEMAEKSGFKAVELIRIRGICLCRERLRKQALSAAGKSSLRKVQEAGDERIAFEKNTVNKCRKGIEKET